MRLLEDACREADLIDAMTQDFNTEHPDIHVEAVYTGNYDDTVTAIQSAIQGGNAPDLFVSLATQRFTMADTKMAMPLDDLIAADPGGNTPTGRAATDSA